MSQFKKLFYDITHLIQKEFDRNSSLYGEKLKCGKGCSYCCSQIFNITLLDGYIISEHIKLLDKDEQYELKQKSESYVKQKSEGLKPPCPALSIKGECTIYEARPVICRRFGIPIYDYKNPQMIHACELNFKAGEEIKDEMLIPEQTKIGMEWDKLKQDYAESINNETGFTTIAEAILKA